MAVFGSFDSAQLTTDFASSRRQGTLANDFAQGSRQETRASSQTRPYPSP